MSQQNGMFFTSLTHGKSPDCRQANASLREKLEDYNFGAYVLEKNCWRCPNNNCNLSFVFILPKTEFFRLKNQVKFDTRPTFLLHRSFKELLGSDKKLRVNAVDQKHVEVQVSVETSEISVMAIPGTENALIQTDAEIQSTNTPVDLSVAQAESDDDDVVVSFKDQSANPMRDQFIEMRPRRHAHSSPKEVKQEPDECEEEEEVSEESHSDSFKSLSESSVRSVSPADDPESIAEQIAEPSPVIKKEPSEISSSVFTTPKSLVRRAATDPDCSSAVKKMRLGNVEQCELCWLVSDFDSLQQYCEHVVKEHTSKFKPSPSLTRDQLIKISNIARECYPERFCGIPLDALGEILKTLP